MGLQERVAAWWLRRKADSARKGKEGVVVQKLLAVLDGYKRVIVILAFVGNAVLELATGHSYAHVLNLLFGALGWGDLAGAGVSAASVAAAATVMWAVVDGIAKAGATRAAQGQVDVRRFTGPAAVLLVLLAQPAGAEMRLSALAGGLASLQPAPADSGAAVTPLVQLAVEADTAPSAHAPKLVVLADLTALPGDQLDLQDPATFRALELSVGLAQPLGTSLLFRLYAEAGFATRLAGDTQPRDRTARWASAGLRFAGEHAWLQVGVGPDQRLGVAPPEPTQPSPLTSAMTAASHDGYQVAVTVRGSVDITSLGDHGRVALVGSAVLGLDLSRRWSGLNGGRNDVVRLGVAVGL